MYKPTFATSAVATLATITLAAFVAGSASAADLRPRPAAPYQPPPPAPVFSWSGCYIGANIGGGWADKSFNDAAGLVTGVPGADLGTHTASGVIGGGQIGCDYQAGVWVFGVQGMFDGSASRQRPPCWSTPRAAARGCATSSPSPPSAPAPRSRTPLPTNPDGPSA